MFSIFALFGTVGDLFSSNNLPENGVCIVHVIEIRDVISVNIADSNEPHKVCMDT